MLVSFTPSITNTKNNRYKTSNAIPPKNFGYSNVATDSVSFTSFYRIKSKNFDPIIEKLNLAQFIEDIQVELSKNTAEDIFSGLFSGLLNKYKKVMKSKLAKMKDPTSFMLTDIYAKSVESILTQSESLMRKAVQMARAKADYKTDVELLNKFKTAILHGDMNLSEVYKRHYSRLKDLTTIDEISEIFPKLMIPPRPENIIGKKIANNLPRNFYLEVGKTIETGDLESLDAVFQKEYIAILEKMFPNSESMPIYIVQNLFKATSKAIVDVFCEAKNNSTLNSLPEQRKIKPLSKEEVNLLKIDFDKFVLHVLQEQHLGGKKLSEIVYVENGLKISPKSLGNTEYKFDKVDERMKAIIEAANKIKEEERNYGKMDNKNLLSRLKDYSSSSIGNNDFLYEHVLDFATSELLENDRTQLIKFLRVLDDIADKKISVDDAIQCIRKENIRPTDTDLIHEAKRKEMMKIQTAERKAIVEFNAYCDNYDSYVEQLYMNNMENAANICSIYRPKNYGAKHSFADKLMSMLLEHTKDGKLVNKKMLDAKIKYFDLYMDAKQNNPDSPIFANALKYVKGVEEGNEILIGQYMRMSELWDTYPASLNLLNKYDSEILTYLKTKADITGDPITHLIKYDNFRNIEIEDRSNIRSVLAHYSLEGSKIDRKILDRIVLGEYKDNPSRITTYLNPEKTSSTESILTPQAKAMIIEDKQFPLVIDYLKEFEDNMTRVAQRKTDRGIHYIGSINKELRKKYKQEVKISYDERLYSTNGDFVFDYYAPGLHKLKTTKA